MLKKNKINKRIIKREKFINLNPSVPVSRQTNYANYIPDQTEVIRMNNKEYTYNDLYKSPHLPDDITPDDYINDEYSIDDKLNSTSDIDSRWEVKSGLNNTWKNESDSNIFNIYKTPNDYVKTTSQAVDYAVDKNRKNLDDLSREMY